ncbi:CsbD family protein [Nitrospirillum sp. BR 11828]|uniref:CsbD family protein n=1 Tax=Nitrospirillum sp. BR 11828 TaxID=3104325 RepID=UPI002ACA5BB6|nr:CsbD family protein [Nitrospirillum sp. BR 11828]MDZ5648314.1 CsbD family protein [Nitrospirillum sp. BR 11828]
MNKNRIEGNAKIAGGAVKETAGKVLGDDQMAAEGKAKKVEGHAQNAAGKIQEAGKALKDTAKKALNE